ncbi:MAG: GIY-YIG nuclease family protein [Methanosarcinales archaeon]|nr:GIY-YIG nuclease family protein [Methanosarcinales archaeon]
MVIGLTPVVDVLLMEEHTFNVPKGKGIYSLILGLDEDKYIRIGALGMKKFPAGYYAYTGSARGTGGFARIKRHLAVASGNNPARHWHIDYLLSLTRPKGVVLTCTYLEIECTISAAIGYMTPTIDGFGCTDCGCSGHLHFEKDIDRLFNVVIEAHKMDETIQKVYSF